ncbi:MAG: hypothetical protein KF802_01015 [Bdellovibrionaceae bacterium]|nr:hypothetical protein [Pseudobdellovibrionaceae bacterium]
MMKTWQEMGFLWDVTADGSPTLRKAEPSPGWVTGEAMHHSGGALEETLMIYGEPVEESFRRLDAPKIFSLGLGLGYVELVTAAHGVRHGKSYEILSLESEEPLVRTFEAFLTGELPPGELLEGLNTVLDLVSRRLGVEGEAIRLSLAQARREGRWKWGGLLAPDRLPAERYHAILYDAFSSKTCPDLWTETFLQDFMKNCTEADCLFSTYACTGALKRSLKGADFAMIQRDGFQGKRHSTLGRRGVFREAL